MLLEFELKIEIEYLEAKFDSTYLCIDDRGCSILSVHEFPVSWSVIHQKQCLRFISVHTVDLLLPPPPSGIV